MPEQFGRYQLLARIGEGGMAEVFQARLESPAGADKILVIKRILAPFLSDPEFIQLFVNEAKIALPLTHGNITSVFEFGEVNGQYFLAMEYIHGKTVETMLDKLRSEAEAMPIEAALFIASEVASGLAYAHASQIVHLDVTPGNILVSYDGAVKLTDFGIAKARKTAEVGRGALRGKASYLAPEQIDRGAVDARTDVFSLGCVLYEMLTRERPYEGDSDEETMQNIRSGSLALPSTLRHDIQDLDPIIQRALAPNPRERFQSAAEFKEAISGVLHKRRPGYGSLNLGESIRSLFSWEIYEEQGDAKEPGLRDRLLFQLTKAQVEVQEGKDSTSELLALRTVSIPPPPPPVDLEALDKAHKKKVLLGGVGGSLLIVGAVLGMVFFATTGGKIEGGPRGKADAGPIAASMGRISVNSWPSSIVYLNGRRLPGKTPVLNYEVPAGEHTLVFEQVSQGLKKELKVTVPAGEDKTVVVNLEK